MDLELLKEVWQKTTEKNVEGYFISAKKIKEIIKKRSNTAVSQIKKRIFTKVLMAGSIGLLMVIFSVSIFRMDEPVFSSLESVSNTQVGLFYIVFGLIAIFISGFNAYSYQKIIRIESYEKDLKTSIEFVLKIIKKAISIKVISDALVLPVTVITFLIIHLVQSSQCIGVLTTIFILLGSVSFGVFSFFLAKKVQNKRYGSQIRILEESLKELEV